MKTSRWTTLLNQVNQVFAFTGFELLNQESELTGYLPWKQTLRDVERSGLSLSDYVDMNFSVPGTTQAIIDKMTELGVFDNKIQRVCEIGPRFGLYLEKVKNRSQPEYYEIYEPSKAWRKWLVEKYNVAAQPVNGPLLTATPAKSIDLVHTHQMLYSQPILRIFRYMMEMARVVNDSGVIVFDIMTAECMSANAITKWIESGSDYVCSMTPTELAVHFFGELGFRYVGAFTVPIGPGLTEYFVFKK